MHILSWNVNGIRAWMKKAGTLEFVSSKYPEILCINETRVDSSLVPKLKDQFSQYPHQFWSCSSKKGYAGVAVLSKIEPISSNLESLEDFAGFDYNGRVIILEFHRFLLVACYFPNSGASDQFIDKKYSWDHAFRQVLTSLLMKNKEIIVIGDLNIVGTELDYFENKGKKVIIHQKETESFQKFLEVGLIDTFRMLNPGLRKFTWFSNKFPKNRENNKGWRIDYAMVSQGALAWVENSLILDDVYGSDHTPIELIINIPN